MGESTKIALPRFSGMTEARPLSPTYTTRRKRSQLFALRPDGAVTLAILKFK